jgi:hypothetical protein
MKKVVIFFISFIVLSAILFAMFGLLNGFNSVAWDHDSKGGFAFCEMMVFIISGVIATQSD